MISLILGICFTFEAIFLIFEIFVSLIKIIFSDLSPVILIVLLFYFFLCVILGQVFFHFARKKYNVGSIFDIDIFTKEKEEHILTSNNIEEIRAGEIIYAPLDIIEYSEEVYKEEQTPEI